MKKFTVSLSVAVIMILGFSTLAQAKVYNWHAGIIRIANLQKINWITNQTQANSCVSYGNGAYQHDGRCYCEEGYRMNGAGTRCLRQTLLYQLHEPEEFKSCANYGTYAYWGYTDKESEGECVCRAGFKWNSNHTRCVKIRPRNLLKRY